MKTNIFTRGILIVLLLTLSTSCSKWYSMVVDGYGTDEVKKLLRDPNSAEFTVNTVATGTRKIEVGEKSKLVSAKTTLLHIEVKSKNNIGQMLQNFFCVSIISYGGTLGPDFAAAQPPQKCKKNVTKLQVDILTKLYKWDSNG